MRLFTAFSYQASSWSQPRRVVAKVEVSALGVNNVRFVTTSLDSSQPSFIYDRIYSARGRMEGFIKSHKPFLHSARPSCHSFEANQFRLFLHSTAPALSRSGRASTRIAPLNVGRMTASCSNSTGV